MIVKKNVIFRQRKSLGSEKKRFQNIKWTFPGGAYGAHKGSRCCQRSTLARKARAKSHSYYMYLLFSPTSFFPLASNFALFPLDCCRYCHFSSAPKRHQRQFFRIIFGSREIGISHFSAIVWVKLASANTIDQSLDCYLVQLLRV